MHSAEIATAIAAGSLLLLASHCRTGLVIAAPGYHNWLDSAAPVIRKGTTHDLVSDNCHWNLPSERVNYVGGIFDKTPRVAHRSGICTDCCLTAIIVPAVLVDPANQHIAITDNPRLLAAFTPLQWLDNPPVIATIAPD